MIKEDYISFETAKLLKDKGFVGQKEHFYENNKIINFINYWHRITPKQRYEAIEAPTLQMVMKWLREVYEIDIIIFRHIRGKRITFYDRIEQRTHLEYQSKCNSYYSYEEAAEAAIKYCLENLI